MRTINLNIESQELNFFDSFLQKDIMGYPVDSLRGEGSYDYNKKRYNRTYRVTIKKEEKTITFRLELSVVQEKICPFKISVVSKPSEHGFTKNEVKQLLDMLILRIEVAEKHTNEKPMKPYEYEARLSTSMYPVKSTIRFGKYKLAPVKTRTKQGWECKLKFSVESIDKQQSITDLL